MSTSGKMIFKIGKTDYPFRTASDGYENGIHNFLSSIKILCTSELISWDEFYNFIKQYATSYGIRFLGLSGEYDLITKLPNIKITDLFDPFGDGYLERDEYEDSDVFYTYNIGYKLTSIRLHGRLIKFLNLSKEECQQKLINYVFTGDIDL